MFLKNLFVNFVTIWDGIVTERCYNTFEHITSKGQNVQINL